MNHTTRNPSGRLWKVLFQWSGVPVSLALAGAIQYLLNPESTWWNFYTEARWTEICITTAGGIAMYAVVFIVVRLLSGWIIRKNVLRNNLLVPFLLTTAVVIGCMFVLLYLENSFYELLWPQSADGSGELEVDVRNYLVVNIIVAAFVNSFYNSFFFFEKWKSEVTETNKLAILSHQLKETSLQAELQVLKLQLDPHFLFNNFSILTQLIETDRVAAQEFVSNLSKVYRYILTTGKKDSTTLDAELKFLQTYFYLIKIRHGEAIQLTIEVSDAARRKGIPPVTLQLLLENAIKHNTSTISKPLQVSIESVGADTIIVKNNLQRINIEYKSTGIGLKNIRERYQLLGGVAPQILETQHFFEIRLPLLNV